MSIRLGSIQYINSLPVDFALRCGHIPNTLSIERAYPAILNHKITRGELDISPVSALHFAEHYDELTLLPNLSISSESGVKSVLLVSKKPWSELEGETIFMSDQGKSTPALLKIILNQKIKISAELKTASFSPQDLMGNPAGNAYVLLGDDALAVYENMADWYIYDLAEEWRSWTAMPFVFAVWVVRNAFLEEHPDEVNALVEALALSRQWGIQNLGQVIEEAKKQSGLEERLLASYYRELRYDLDQDLMDGLWHYWQCASKEGILSTMPPTEPEALVMAKSN